MNHIMYVVKNETGKFLVSDYYQDEWVYSWSKVPELYEANDLEFVRDLAIANGGQVYQVTVTISDTPVTVS